MIHFSPFIPHPLEALAEGVFPSPLPEPIYAQACKKFAAVEDVVTEWIEYNSDGLRVTGVRCLPRERGSDGQLPLLIFNRGGHGRYGMLTVLQVLKLLHPLARMGYAVYASNYRGNDGGEGQEEFGGADAHDVVNLLALAKQQPEWDGRNAFMVGWSRGGMMTLRAIAESANVNAACTIAGLTNLPQALIDRPHLKEQMYGRLIAHADESEFARAIEHRSAVCWPEKLRATPLLMHHGDADDIVPMMHSETLGAELDRISHLYELVRYAGGDHFLNKEREGMLAATDVFFRRHWG